MTLTYQTFSGPFYDLFPQDQVQKAQVLGWGNDYTFYVPFNANYFRGKGARLLINAVGGAPVMNYVIDNDPLCFHIWGI